MPSNKQTPPPPSPEARENILTVLRSTPEPLASSALAKLLQPPHQIKDKVLAPILEEFVATGALYRLPPKAAKGKPRYWDRDAVAMGRSALLETIQKASSPLEAKDAAKRVVTPLGWKAVDIAPHLESFAEAGTIFRFPPKSAKGSARYWHSGPLEFGRLAIRQLIESKGPQPEPGLRKAAKELSDDQFRSLLSDAFAARELFRHPPLGKPRKELIGVRPPSPDPYLRDIGKQLTAIVGDLLSAEVPREDVRRTLVQMIEAAGISFPAAEASSRGAPATQGATSIDLISLMRRLDPAVDRGALVGVRELRRAAKLEKPHFDRAVLDLMRQGRLSLHRHDYPANLTAEERDELVTDGNGTYYVGVAIRQSPT